MRPRKMTLASLMIALMALPGALSHDGDRAAALSWLVWWCALAIVLEIGRSDG